MKRIALLRERVATSAATGTHCPVSGLWSPDAQPQEAQAFFEGQVIPSHNATATVWRRTPQGPDSRQPHTSR
jgi:hypothetical protein